MRAEAGRAAQRAAGKLGAGRGAAHRTRFALLASVCLLLAGCTEDIVFQVNQAEAIEIVVVLGENGIDAKTLPEASDKEPLFKIQVSAADALRAKEILLRQQLPKVKPRGLNEIFQSPSMIPTATEERARLVLALQGDLAGTLETVDNVVDAQVHVVLPEANPLESAADRTQARAAVLIKYRQIPPVADEEERTRERWRQKESLLLALRDDLLRLQEIWEVRLDELEKRDAEQIKDIELYLLKRVDDADARAANNALIRLRKNHNDRAGFVSVLKNLPKLKDLDGTLREIDSDEGIVLPIRAASVRGLVANSIPRLRENSVTVEYTPVSERKDSPAIAAQRAAGAPKQLVLILGGAAAVMTLGVIGLAAWVMSLQKKLKAKA